MSKQKNDIEMYATLVGHSDNIIEYVFLKQDAGGVREKWFMNAAGILWDEYHEKATHEALCQNYRYKRITKEEYYIAMLMYVKE